jgi:hypothetical protein
MQVSPPAPAHRRLMAQTDTLLEPLGKQNPAALTSARVNNQSNDPFHYYPPVPSSVPRLQLWPTTDDGANCRCAACKTSDDQERLGQPCRAQLMEFQELRLLQLERGRLQQQRPRHRPLLPTVPHSRSNSTLHLQPQRPVVHRPVVQ